MHLLLALDKSFEHLASIAIVSFLLHQKFESLVVVSPEAEKFDAVESIAHAFGVPYRHHSISSDSPLNLLSTDVRPYFYCIEALDQELPGRYLYVDADTLCISNLESLANLDLDSNRPIAACSHGRPMPDRSLILGLESPYHYFNAGILLFDSNNLNNILSPRSVVQYFLKNNALCRFREQCCLNVLLKDNIQFLPGQFNVLSWMRERQSKHKWQDLSANPMAYCLPYIRENKSIIHFSNGSLPNKIKKSCHEKVDYYWLLIERNLGNLTQIPHFSDL